MPNIRAIVIAKLYRPKRHFIYNHTRRHIHARKKRTQEGETIDEEQDKRRAQSSGQYPLTKEIDDDIRGG